jgi:hypothetical protein
LSVVLAFFGYGVPVFMGRWGVFLVCRGLVLVESDGFVLVSDIRHVQKCRYYRDHN